MKKKLKNMESISEMFLIPKGIYFNIVKNIEDPDQLKRVEDLNAETNYLEKALRFHQLKSFKSQPKEKKKQSSPDKEIDDSHSTVGDDDADEMQAEYVPQQTFDDMANVPPPIHTTQTRNSISAPPLVQHNTISPVANFPQPQQQRTREADSSQTETDRAKFLINWAINDILHSSSLKCPLCKKSTDFKKPGYFARHMHQKHDYLLNDMEQRMVKENLDKLSQKQQAKPKKRVLLNPSFLQSHREDMRELNQARKLSQAEINKQIRGEEQQIINQAKKRPVFDQQPDKMESTVKLRKLSQQEIDKQITEGKKRPNLKTNRNRTKKLFTPIPPDKWERINTRQIQRRRAGKRKRRGEEDDDEEEEGDDEKLIKLDSSVNWRELPFYLPPTLRGKRRWNEEDDDDIILTKKRKMIMKKFKPLTLKNPTVRLNNSKLALRPEDRSLKLRTPTVKLSKSKLALTPEDRRSLTLRTPTVKLSKSKLALTPEDRRSLTLRTPTVKLSKSKLALTPEDRRNLTLRTPTVKLSKSKLALTPEDRRNLTLRTPTVKLSKSKLALTPEDRRSLTLRTPTVKLSKSKLALTPEDRRSLKLRTPTVKLNKSKLALRPEDRRNLTLRMPTVKLNKSKLALRPEDRSLKLRTPTVTLNRVAKNPFYTEVDEKLRMKPSIKLRKFPILKRLV